MIWSIKLYGQAVGHGERRRIASEVVGCQVASSVQFRNNRLQIWVLQHYIGSVSRCSANCLAIRGSSGPIIVLQNLARLCKYHSVLLGFLRRQSGDLMGIPLLAPNVQSTIIIQLQLYIQLTFNGSTSRMENGCPCHKVSVLLRNFITIHLININSCYIQTST